MSAEAQTTVVPDTHSLELAATAEPEVDLGRNPIQISAKAAEMARKQLQKRGTPDAMIRLGIRGSGCSGFTYVIEFEDRPARDGRDRVIDVNGAKFVVDRKSLLYLAGSALDWEQKRMSAGFKFSNPNEKSTCGCGHSFTV